MTGLKDELPAEERYENLGGVYFPILQQDGSRVLVRVGRGKSHGDLIFLHWLRQHDRHVGAVG